MRTIFSGSVSGRQITMYCPDFSSTSFECQILTLPHPRQLMGVTTPRASLFADSGIHRADGLTQFRLNRGVGDPPGRRPSKSF
jgi:hypothetical protein